MKKRFPFVANDIHRALLHPCQLLSKLEGLDKAKIKEKHETTVGLLSNFFSWDEIKRKWKNTKNVLENKRLGNFNGSAWASRATSSLGKATEYETWELIEVKKWSGTDHMICCTCVQDPRNGIKISRFGSISKEA